MRYTLGLDIGITSVGWCVIDEESARHRIVDLGVRVFPVAENPKDGSSLGSVRRLARGARRRLKRRRERLHSIRDLFIEFGLVPNYRALEIFFNSPHYKTPYELRVDGLDRALEPEEWLRVLAHIAKRRGFKSNRKSDSTGEDARAKNEGALLQGVGANKELLANYRTVGEMMAKDLKFADHKRNKSGDYSGTMGRDMLLKEIAILFETQRRLGNSCASEELQARYTELFAFQLPFASGDQIEKMTGACTFFTDEKRAPAMCRTAEHFKVLSRVLTLMMAGKGAKKITAEQRDALVNLAYAKNKVTYADVRKLLEMDDVESFKGVRYGRGGEKADRNEKAEKETVFVELKGFHILRKTVEKALGKPAWEALTGRTEQLDAIGRALTFYKTDEDIKAFLAQFDVAPEIVEAVLPVSFRGVMHMSLKAMRLLIPFMEQGDGYDVACAKAGFVHYDPVGPEERTLKLPPLGEDEESPRNPVVIRALSQTRKVVNAVIDRWGSPTWVNVELARDLSKPFDERKQIQKEQLENKADRDRSVGVIESTFNFPHPSGMDVLKYRLWQEQHGQCAYSQRPIQAERLFEPNYAEIDHAIPYSRSMDDSYSNKVLVLADENRNKGNKTPCEYMRADTERWAQFEVWTMATIRSRAKQSKLLKETYTAEDEAEMKDRNLSDTRYITRFAADWLRRSLQFADDAIAKPVLCVNGRMTALLRGRWGLAKKRDEGDLHHALDAAVVAACTGGMVQKISEHSRKKELYQLRTSSAEDGQKERFPEPWPGFRNELLARLSSDPLGLVRENKIALPDYTADEIAALRPVFVSRAPRRKAKGAGHKETVRSFKPRGPEEKWQTGTVVRTSIKTLKLGDLENMVGRERDVKLYETLKQRLLAFDGKAEKAFAEPFYKPTRDGTQGPPVHTIKIYSSGASGIPVRGGLADNGEMVRVDVYTKAGKYHLVPHYIDDIARKRVKKRAIVANKPESQWTKIDETFVFCFSLFKDDLVRVVAAGKEFRGYYTGTDRSTGAITLESHDSKELWRSLGVKTCLAFEKYQVDVLGGYHKVAREPLPQGKR